MQKLSLMILSLVLVVSGMVNAAGGAMPGSGTESDPYLIEDLADFDVFADEANAGTYWSSGVYTKLVCDIDLSGRVYDKAVIAPDTDNTQLWYQGNNYYGVFDGNGHKITGLTITPTAGEDYLGLFGRLLGSTAAIKNLNVENYSITGTNLSDVLGAICGMCVEAKIDSCHGKGMVSGCYYLGGVCGVLAGGEIIDSSIECEIICNNSVYAGGICGIIDGSSSITDCSSVGVISGIGFTRKIGCLCGYNNSSTISRCSAEGSIRLGVDSELVGGFCGENNSGTIEHSYSQVSVEGGDSLGVFCGSNNDGTIRKCYASGDIRGESNVGGFLGYNNTDEYLVTYCYSSVLVLGMDRDTTGGFCGDYESKSSLYCIYDGEKNSYYYVGGAYPASTAEMQMMSTYTDKNWDFVNYSNGGTDSDWYMADYPILSWQIEEFVEMPYVGNILPSEADVMLANAGLLTGVVSNEYSNVVAEGMIISLEYEAGDYLASGSSVDYTVSLGVWPVVPELVMMTLAGAESAILDAGLEFGGAGYVYHDFFEPGRVCSQYPAAGVMLGAGEKVYINVSLGVCPGLAGSGTEEDPYLIASLADFVEFSDVDNEGVYWAEGVYARLTNDIDLETMNYTNSVVSSYNGIFDGDGHVISNLRIGSMDGFGDLGLFGWLRAGSVVRALGLEDVEVRSGNRSNYIGSLCGMIYGEGAKIEGCYSTGSVTAGEGVNFVGGLCGRVANEGVLTDSYSVCTVSAGRNSDNIGGLCGAVNGTVAYCYAGGDVSGEGVRVGGLCGGIGTWSGITGTVSNSYATGSISGVDYVGGFCGESISDVVINCYATGEVSGEDYIGGFIGYGSASGCYATGNVTGASKVGGFVGYGGGENCYATGEVTGLAEVGGFVGTLYNVDVKYCYSTGKVSGYSEVGGFIGVLKEGVSESNFWDVEASGFGSVGDVWAGSTGMTTAQMQTRQTYGDADWNMVYQASNYDSREYIAPDWYMEEGSYPQKPWEFACDLLPGKGSSYNPFLIEDISDFDILCDTRYFCHEGVHVKLMCDLDLEGRVYDNSPIAPQCYRYSDNERYVEVGFAGVFDGNGYVISNINIEPDGDNIMQCIGFFGRVKGENAEIKNLGIENITISDTVMDNYVNVWEYRYGGLCGSNQYGVIRNCYTTGMVGGIGLYSQLSNSNGGLCGYNLAGEITGSHSLCDISGGGGGLCGWNRGGSITNCYAAGEIFNGGGGLCGYSLDYSPSASSDIYYASIKDCYASGNVSGKRYVGGFIARNCSLVENCYATGNVEGIEFLGGFASSNEYDSFVYHAGNISQCHSTGDVNVNVPADYIIDEVSYAGGFCGKGRSDITNCYSEGNVTVNNECPNAYSKVGGFCGGSVSSTLRISYCFSTGSVYAGANSESVGGFCGFSSQATIFRNYSRGDVEGGKYVGGFLGYADGCSIGYNYSTGEVDGNEKVGGFAGYFESNRGGGSFWDVETSGMADPEAGEEDTDGMAGKMTSEMYDIDTYLDAGWDFRFGRGSGTISYWYMPVDDYPILTWQEGVPLTPDIDGDRDIDIIDFTRFASYWGECDCGEPGWCGGRDFDMDRCVNMNDLLILASNWLAWK